MRQVEKTITYRSTVIQNIPVTSEQISTITEDKINHIIIVRVTSFNESEKVHERDVVIEGENYTLLMSEYPSFAENKPQNEYREVDLWYIIDILENS